MDRLIASNKGKCVLCRPDVFASADIRFAGPWQLFSRGDNVAIDKIVAYFTARCTKFEARLVRYYRMQTLSFSNGVTIDSSQIVSIESNQQSILFPGESGELDHLLDGRPSGLQIRLRDGSTVEIQSGTSRLMIQSNDSTSASGG